MTRSLFALLLFFSFVLPSAAQGTQPGAAVVENFQAALISVMKDAAKLGYDGRYRKLDPAIKQSHDLPAITRVATGRHWDKLSEEQKTRLVDLFSKLSVAAYASQFDSYSGQTFKTVDEQKLANNDRLVRTEFSDAQGGNISFDYTLRESGATWRIINIVVDGVSDLAIRRAEYASIIKRDGIDGLFAKLQEKISGYERLAKK